MNEYCEKKMNKSNKRFGLVDLILQGRKKNDIRTMKVDALYFTKQTPILSMIPHDYSIKEVIW